MLLCKLDLMLWIFGLKCKTFLSEKKVKQKTLEIKHVFEIWHLEHGHLHVFREYLMLWKATMKIGRGSTSF